MTFNHYFSVITSIIAYIPNSDAYSLLSLIIAGITGIASLFVFIAGDSDKKKVMGSTLGVVFLLGGGVFVWLHYFNQPPPPPHEWTTLLQEFAPACGQPESGTWRSFSSLPANTISCTNSGLLMQRQGLNSLNGAEEDLIQVNGNDYSQVQFRTHVDVQFQTTLRDSDTVAGLIVQTPASSTGGYIFALNNTGYWALKSVPTTSGQQETTVDSGSVSITTNQSVSLEVDVQNGVLTGYINGQQVTQYNDSLDATSTIIGLLVEWIPNGVTPVMFRDFKLDQ